MSSKDVIKHFISSTFPAWEKISFPDDIAFSTVDNELYKLENGEIVLFSYTNVNITGTERSKPQIRVFLEGAQAPFAFSKENNYRFFLFTIFTQDDSMATGLTAFAPRNFIVSLETNLDNETSRRDLRSLYDYVQENLRGEDFIRCPRGAHNAGINQASFINIGDENHRIKNVFKNYVTFFDNRPYLESKDLQSNQNKVDSLSEDNEDYTQSYDQRIFYGVPGCGKSNKIKLILDKAVEQGAITDKDEQIVRVVFHPEYTNSDFIGQIMPKRNKDGHIDYSFEAGPFAKILRQAYLNPSKPYYLIVEEVNRGNAAAIFGDVFQLLDRFDKDESEEINGNCYGEGWSSYSINNSDINWYIRNCSDKTESDELNTAVEVIYNTTEKPYSEIKVGGITINANTGLRLPPNLSILGTMNTSDQNVFTLDNAFQRRWNPELIENDFPKEGTDEWNESVPLQQNADIAESGIKWDSFRTAINKVIAKESVNTGLSSMEDKRLGCWFVKNTDGKISAELFANKVLKYLWDDAFKFSRSKIFGSYMTFEELRKDFIGSKKIDVFTIKLEGLELNANQNEGAAQQDGE